MNSLIPQTLTVSVISELNRYRYIVIFHSSFYGKRLYVGFEVTTDYSIHSFPYVLFFVVLSLLHRYEQWITATT